MEYVGECKVLALPLIGLTVTRVNMVCRVQMGFFNEMYMQLLSSEESTFRLKVGGE